MIHVYTIGFTKKDAKQFFTLLRQHNIKRLIDIRLNNSSQLAGFAKGRDLPFFLKEICNCDYLYKPELAPTKTLLDGYKKGTLSWESYTIEFKTIINQRKIESIIDRTIADKSCFLCSESTAEKCHRKLVVEYLKNKWKEVEIKHL